MTNWPSTALSVPQETSVGLDATRTFCSITEYSSRLVARVIDRLWLAGLIGVAALALIAFAVYRIWPYLLEALDIYGNELTTFLGIGLLAIPIGFIFNLLVQILARYSPFDQVLGWLSLSGGAAFTAASIVGGLQQAAMLLIVVPAVVQAMKQIRRGERPTVRGSYRASIRHFGANLTGWIIYFVLLASVGFTIIALPFAIYFGVTMQFFIQAVILEHEKPGWNALICSWRTTRAQLVRTLSLSIGFLIIAVLPGPVGRPDLSNPGRQSGAVCQPHQRLPLRPAHPLRLHRPHHGLAPPPRRRHHRTPDADPPRPPHRRRRAPTRTGLVTGFAFVESLANRLAK